MVESLSTMMKNLLADGACELAETTS